MNRNRAYYSKFVAQSGSIRGAALEGTQVVRDIVLNQGRSGLQAKALGESVIAAILTASLAKSGQKVNLNIRSSGVCKQVLIDVDSSGKVRGYSLPQDSTQESSGSSLALWGDGLLSVLKSADRPSGATQPFIGTVPLVTGDLAKDLTFYWAQSEQVPSAVGIDVGLSAEGELVSAGGFIVQVLPGASSNEVDHLETILKEIGSLSNWMSESETPVHLLSKLLGGQAFVVLEEKDVFFGCNCSKERVLRALALIGPQEVQDILEEDGATTVQCDFCRRSYSISEEDLRNLLTERESNGF